MCNLNFNKERLVVGKGMYRNRRGEWFKLEEKDLFLIRDVCRVFREKWFRYNYFYFNNNEQYGRRDSLLVS